MPSKSNKKSHTSKRLSQSAQLNGKRARETSKEETYVVEKIVDKKKMDGVWKYKVKWAGYPNEDCTWEPIKHLDSVKELVAQFDLKHKKKAKQEEEEEEEEEVKDVSEAESEKSEKEDEEEEENKKPVRRSNNKGKVSRAKSSKTKASADKDHSAKADKKSTTKKNMASPYKKVKTDDEPEEPEPVKKTIYGHFKLGDKPHKIINARKERDEIIFTIEWEPRIGGKVPLNTEMTGLELRKYDKDLLLDFYEDRLRFVKPTPKDSVKKSLVKPKPEELIDEDLSKQNDQKMKEEETNATTYRDQELIRSEVGGNDLAENIPETKKGKVLNIIDLENSPQEIEDEKPEEVKEEQEEEEKSPKEIEEVDEVQEIDKSEVQKNGPLNVKENDEEPKKSVFEPENIIDNKGQPIFADVGYNAADDIRDLALDEHLRVVSQSHQDLSKPEIVSNDNTQTNGVVQQQKPEPEDLQLDSPKEISDIGSESSGLDNI